MNLDTKREYQLELALELAEYLCQVAGVLPSNCDADNGCKDEECIQCKAFDLCRKYRKVTDLLIQKTSMSMSVEVKESLE